MPKPNQSSVQVLLDDQRRLLQKIKPSYQRRFYDQFSLDQRFVGLVGPRGVGKTTFLIEYVRRQLQLAQYRPEQILYFSADHLFFSDHALLYTIDYFVQEHNLKLICIDEVHRYQNWNQELKNIYDSYPDLKVIFSGSSSIDLVKGKYDLSRRALLENFPGFSFREFLEVETGQQLPVFTLKQILQPDSKTASELEQLGHIPKIMGWFHQYFQQGYYPTYLEFARPGIFHQSLIEVMTKIIYQDIADFYRIPSTNLRQLKKIMQFFATSQPGKLNPNKIAKSLGINRQTVIRYIEILQETGLLRFILIDKVGHALIRNAEKILLDNSNLLWAINTQLGKKPQIGVARETFALNQLQNAGYVVSYPQQDGKSRQSRGPGQGGKSVGQSGTPSKQADFMVDGWLLEVGGQNKDKSQLESVEQGRLLLDDQLFSYQHRVPLYLLGFLY